MATEQTGPSFYALGDDAMGEMVTAAPRRTWERGRADIGGRMRVVSILRNAGISGHESPERIAGSTNEVWRAGDHVVRVGFVPGASRLRREARLVKLLPHEVQYPKVVASGIEPFGEWIVVRHRPGMVLSEAWASMDVEARRSVVIDLAQAVRAVHRVALDAEMRRELIFDEGVGPLALPHQLPASRLVEMLSGLYGRPYVDRGLLRATEERLREVGSAVGNHETHGLVHGDLHFENVLVMHDVLVAMLDFEWARLGPAELDLDVLARFCADPEVHVGGDYSIKAADFRPVLEWFREGYPELFEHDLLRERLMLCALAYEVPALVAMPPNAAASQLSPHHPMNRLRDLLDHGTHAERLGWEPSSGF